MFLTYTFPSSNVKILPYLTGFYIIGGTGFSLQVLGTYVSNVNYKLNISTASTCQVHTVKLYVVILLEDGLNGKYFYVANQNLMISTTGHVNSASWTTTISDYSNT